MKIVINLKTIPELNGLDKAASRRAWVMMSEHVSSIGGVKGVPIICAGAMALMIFFSFGLLSVLPPISNLARSSVIILAAGIGGYLIGIITQSMSYAAGKGYLRELMSAQNRSEPQR